MPHTGFIALFSFVPLFEFARRCDSGAYKHPNWLAYLAFLVFNIVTTFWIWWISPAGAVAAIVLNALQMYVVFWLFQKTKKVFQGALPYIFFISMWIAWERAYQVCEISWPWLILGNSFATATKLVQWYEYTGFLGGSLWVLLVSFLTFTTIRLF
ncbi:MAG: apolipoprotein N-acyltransferase, partial [Bacteroidales bacterium]|nr:apolipoprotein N-acyltransferase [Bacteroidales bacterium]